MNTYIEDYTQYLSKWAEAYLTPKTSIIGQDPHSEFSRLTGIDRLEAKVLCYKIIYQSTFLQNHIKATVEFNR